MSDKSSPLRIDAHQHFWTLSRGDYGWLTPDLKPLYRNFTPDDLEPLLAAAEVGGTILVQAAPTDAETDFLLEIAAHTPFVIGVVGWVDFEHPDAPARIAKLASDPALVGLRPMIQDIADPDWMLQPDLQPVFEALIANDLVFDALTLPRHLKNLHKLLSEHPEMRVVIDHASKPGIAAQEFDGWAKDMARIARETGAFCKLSGMVTEAATGWKTSDLRRYTDHLLEVFGPDRLIWGSDWPVLTLRCNYETWLETTEELLSGLTAQSRAAIFGGNAARAYRLGAR